MSAFESICSFFATNSRSPELRTERAQMTTPSTNNSTKNTNFSLETLQKASFYHSHAIQLTKGGISRQLLLDYPASFPPAAAVSKPWLYAIFPGGFPPGTTPGATGSGNTPSSYPPSASSPAAKKPTLFSIFPTNPNLGLFLLTPLVPAPDNRPALALLTTVQFLLGLSLMTRRVPKIGETRLRHRMLSASRFSVGAVAVFLSAFEALRLSIPYDPWADEAKMWRQWAVKNGHNPSWWFGAITFYTPMSLSEWKLKTTTWIGNTINMLESDRETELQEKKDTELLTSISIGPRAVLKAGESNTYHDIYENLFTKNCRRSKELLEGELTEVTELNKAARVDALLENKGHVHLNEEYMKPNIQLGTHTLEDDAEFEMVWANFEPWDELRHETDFDVRLIPRWRCVDELSGDDGAPPFSGGSSV